MLMPSKVKYRKQQRGRMRGKAHRGGTLAFGDIGLQVLEPELPGRLLQLLFLFDEIRQALLGQRLALLLLHRISISDSRVISRVFSPSLSAASSRASLPVAKSTPSIS